LTSKVLRVARNIRVRAIISAVKTANRNLIATLSNTQNREDKVQAVLPNRRRKISALLRSRVVNSRGIGVAFARLSGFSILLLVLLALGCGVPSVVSPGSPSETAPGEGKFEMAGPNKAAMIVRVKIKWTGALRLRARYGRDLHLC
jgi:hypothetical protein